MPSMQIFKERMGHVHAHYDDKCEKEFSKRLLISNTPYQQEVEGDHLEIFKALVQRGSGGKCKRRQKKVQQKKKENP